MISRQELAQDWMPVPSVIWETEQWRLRIRAEATPSGELRVHYRFENLTDAATVARVCSCWCARFKSRLRGRASAISGGVSRFTICVGRRGGSRSTQAMRIVTAPARSPPASARCVSTTASLPRALPSGLASSAAHAVHDAFGFAAGAHAVRSRAAGVSSLASERFVCLGRGCCASRGGAGLRLGRLECRATQWTGNGWIDRCHPCRAHGDRAHSGDALRAGAAAGSPALHALLDPRRRHDERRAAAHGSCTRKCGEFIRWYAPHQRADGFVPCCVDREGVDWLVEHDSHGELIALIADYYRFTSDRRAARGVLDLRRKGGRIIEASARRGRPAARSR